MMLRQLFGREGWAKISISLAHDRQRQRADFGRQSMIARFATALREQARGAVPFEITQEAEHLTPTQIQQRAGIGDAEPTRLNPQ
jgi:hypothetical protein